VTRTFIRTGASLLAVAALVMARATAALDEPAPTTFTARGGLDVAADAARAWAPDARLVYLENDEDVRPDGTTGRWGYLFFSARAGQARGYSVRDGKLEEAADLGFDFDAPPVSEDWIDSGAALVAAEQKAGARYRAEHGGRLATMLLIRGAFHDEEPNATTWAFVYTADHVPALFVVVDAKNGDVVKTWRG
jgi:hypothetical protein